MNMNDKLIRYLYEACVRIDATPEKEDLLVGLCYVQLHRGYITNEEIDIITEFLWKTGSEVTSTWKKGFETFRENAYKAIEEIKKREEAKQQ